MRINASYEYSKQNKTTQNKMRSKIGQTPPQSPTPPNPAKHRYYVVFDAILSIALLQAYVFSKLFDANLDPMSTVSLLNLLY